jgi:uncharacterized membrane protein
MYILDPVQGRRRRALLRDKIVHALHAMGDALGATARDARNRATGVVAETRARLHDEQPSDDVLVDEVRSQMGRVVSHPGSIVVMANNGRIVLSGPILAREVDDLLDRVRSLRGVRDVENQLDVHETGTGVPGLQGGDGEAEAGSRVARRTADLLRRRWPPTARIATGAAGSALVVYGTRKRGVLGTALGLTGAALVARSSANQELKGMLGLGGGRSIDIRKTITIHAPVDQVFAFMSEFENYPAFMSHVRDVQQTDERHTHWVVDGPAGVPVEWDAETTSVISNELIAWKSLPGSTVRHEGRVRLEPTEDRATRVSIQMSYRPPAGMAGHAVASFLGANPKQEMDDDLARVKTAMETGRPARDAARPM